MFITATFSGTRAIQNIGVLLILSASLLIASVVRAEIPAPSVSEATALAVSLGNPALYDAAADEFVSPIDGTRMPRAEMAVERFGGELFFYEAARENPTLYVKDGTVLGNSADGRSLDVINDARKVALEAAAKAERAAEALEQAKADDAAGGVAGDDDAAAKAAAAKKAEEKAAPFVATTETFNNPISKISSLRGLLIALLEAVLVLAIPVIAFFIIYAGFLYVTARGRAEQVTAANKALLWSVVGGVIILGAFVIINIISGTVEGFR